MMYWLLLIKLTSRAQKTSLFIAKEEKIFNPPKVPRKYKTKTECLVRNHSKEDDYESPRELITIMKNGEKSRFLTHGPLKSVRTRRSGQLRPFKLIPPFASAQHFSSFSGRTFRRRRKKRTFVCAQKKKGGVLKRSERKTENSRTRYTGGNAERRRGSKQKKKTPS